jgi:hypothetical protein
MYIRNLNIVWLLVFILSLCKEIQAQYSSNREEEWNIWLIACISIGSAAILLLITLVCCCCCPFCKFSDPKEPPNNQTRRSSSFRFNITRSATPSAPVDHEQSQNSQGRISMEPLVTNEPVDSSDHFANATAPYPPAYSTLPTSGHRTISMPSDTSSIVIAEISPTVGGNTVLHRQNTTTSEDWYDARTLER